MKNDGLGDKLVASFREGNHLIILGMLYDFVHHASFKVSNATLSPVHAPLLLVSRTVKATKETGDQLIYTPEI